MASRPATHNASPLSSSFRHTLRHHTALSGLIVLGLVATGGLAHAQTATTTGTAPAATTSDTASTTTKTDDGKTSDTGTTTVTVTGAKPQSRIDRQVYDNTKNIDSATGTAADALNKVPSVNVDANGNVTLRGNSSVQVYVDGKPSAMMSGDNRAGALQAMSSSDISSVEVMTNPGAQFSSEGSGGIINLVMKKNRRPGGFGSAAVSLGSTGGYNGNFSGSYTAGKMTVQGSLNYRDDKRKIRTGLEIQPLDSSGNPVSTTQTNSLLNGSGTGLNSNGEIDYNLSDKDQVSAQLNYSSRTQTGKGLMNNAVYNAAGGATAIYTNQLVSKSPHEDYGADFTWNHTGDQPGETLKADLRVARSDGLSDQNNTYVYSLGTVPGSSPATTTATNIVHSSNNLNNAVLSVDYARFVGQDQLSLGTQITHDSNEFISHSTGLGSVSNASLTSDFAYEQTISAAYITYQKPFGDKWVVLGGLRAENLNLDTDQVASGVTSHINYTKVSPSFFASYVISDTNKLRFSYSHRLQRPNAQLLNPSLQYNGTQNVSQGNPDLKPQETDSFELRYEVTKPTFNYSLNGYYRKNDHVLTQISSIFSPGVILTSQASVGSSSAGGVEFVTQGNLSPALTVGVNGNLYDTQLTTPNIAGTQSLTTLSGRVTVAYKVTPKDNVQFFFFTSGKQLTGQGYRSPFAMGNLSFSHAITPKTMLIFTVNDPFRTAKTTTFTKTNSLLSEQTFSQQAMVMYIGLRFTLGGPSAAQMQQMQQSQYRGGPPGGGGYRGGPGGGGPGGPGGM